MARKLVCPKCGGEDIVLDATARWDSEKQEYDFEVAESKYDFCGDCEGEVRSEFVEIDSK